MSAQIIQFPFSAKPPIKQKKVGKNFLTPTEVEQLLKGAKLGDYPIRDYTIILLMFRHGLRTQELISLQWKHINLNEGWLYVHRCKGSRDSTHPLTGTELRYLKRHSRTELSNARYVFLSKRRSPLSARAIRNIVAIAAERAGMDHVHPHMLRHSTGYYLANQGVDTRAIQAYLGHRQIRHTILYTEVNSSRFEGFWQD